MSEIQGVGEPMKVLSFEVDGEVYILGTPDYTIAEFDRTAEISQVFKIGLKPIDNEDPEFAQRVNEAFSFVLRSDPRVQTLTRMGDLLDRKILPELAVAVLVALKEFDNFIVMSFFKCNKEAADWHRTGKPFAFNSNGLSIADGDFSSFRALLKRSIPQPKDTYSSPKLAKMDMAAYKYLSTSESIH